MRPRQSPPLRGAALALGLGLLAGCGSLPDLAPAAAPPPAAAAVAATQDPLLAFAASAAPGSQGVVNGERVRVARAYAAASGRDCRELLIGGGLAERSAIACRDETTGWSLARPLLRGSGAGRP